MKIIKTILNQGVDLIFLMITLGLLIWHMIDQTKNFTLFLALIAGYVIFNIINKVKLSLNIKEDENNEPFYDVDENR